MDEIKALRLTILLLLLISLFHIPKTASKHAGFSLKLIRPDSPKSNITFLERYKSYVRASKARASYWTFFKANANKTIQPHAIRPPLTKEHDKIVVVMRIGTPAQQVFLDFDTGSTLSWTQCVACTTCFPQSTPKFDPRQSTSYREMSIHDPKCRPPIYVREQPCEYKVSYIVGQYSNGLASYDTFSSMDNNPDQTVANIRFGCSIEAGGFSFPPDTFISGMLGMSRTEESLPSQLNQYAGISRFSYCLIGLNTGSSVFNLLTFGDDIPNTPGQNLAKVPFIEHPLTHAWAINIIDVSVGEERLNLPPETFALNQYGGSGGLVLDTGAPVTVITRDAYRAIKSKIQDILSTSELDFAQVAGPYDLCYVYNRPIDRLPTDYLPTLTFHLENDANLVIPVTSVYIFNPYEKVFCLGLWPAESNWPNILGALQQQDTRFIYDLNENSLSFTPELCT